MCLIPTDAIPIDDNRYHVQGTPCCGKPLRVGGCDSATSDATETNRQHDNPLILRLRNIRRKLSAWLLTHNRIQLHLDSHCDGCARAAVHKCEKVTEKVGQTLMSIRIWSTLR